MIGLDSNVLIRYLSWDDPAQADRAAREIEAASSRGDSLFISSVVLCEVVWVLEDAYGFKRKDLLSVLEKMLRTAQFVFDDKDLCWRALDDYRQGKGDFSDHLIGRAGQKAGCSQTITFDRELKNSRLFRVLP
jgi:predicted nucleic-acid-binding protein